MAAGGTDMGDAMSNQAETGERSGPLARFTVLDLTRVRAGPTCVKQFGDWGADVIRIEAPPEGDASRRADFSERHGSDFQNLHRNKRSLTLNLKAPDGLEILKRLAERADVLVENYRPKVKHRLGIDYEAMRAVNPRLVYTSISGFGQDGPYAKRPGVDQVAQGMGGLMSITGEPGRGPMRAGIPVADIAAGLHAALGTLVALLEREVSGEGQWVQTSLLEAQLSMLDFQAAAWLIDARAPGQAGNAHPTVTPMGAYRTRDGHVNIAPMPAMWHRFCRVLGLDELSDDPDYTTRQTRLENRDALTGLIEAKTTLRDSAEWVARFAEAEIPCGPIHSIDQSFADEQVRHLGIVSQVRSPALGSLSLLGQPVRLSRTPSALRSAAPEAGEHKEAVLTDLGYSAADIARLRGAGVV